MGVEEEVLGALVPDGISKSLRWRLVVSLSISGIFVFILWSMGAFASLGFDRFARAGEIENLSSRVGRVEVKQDTGLRLALAAEICRLHWERMKASGFVWETLNRAFDERQVEYAGVNHGSRYLVDECSKPQ